MQDINSSYRDVLRNLDLLFTYMNHIFFAGELSTPLITIEIEDEKRKNIKGFYQRKSPYGVQYVSVDRINISPHFFKPDKGATWITISTTLLHEMIHLYAKIKKKSDFENGKHTLIFKKLAEEHGMVVIDIPHPQYGYYHTALTEYAKTLIGDFCKDFELPLITST